MPSHKRLNGLAHDIMDHSVSGLSYLQPNLAQVSAIAGIRTVTLDLLAESPLPEDMRIIPPAVFACEALHRTFLSLMAKLGYTKKDIASATLIFEFPDNPLDDPYRFGCTTELVSARGRVFTHSMHTDTYYEQNKVGR